MSDVLRRYSLAEYGGMLGDPRRVDAYRAALEATVGSDTVVLELGTGTGAFALLAARLGARHVYALEPNPAIRVARRMAEHNGLADRITFLEDLSTRVTLPERADVILSDMRGVSPFFESHLDAIQDARERHLAEGGCLIPREDRVFVALLESPRTWRDVVGPWDEEPLGLDMHAARDFTVHTYGRAWAEQHELLSEPVLWSLLDYRTLASTSGDGEVALRASRDGTAHGALLWFDTELVENVGFSNAPGEPRGLYGQQFLPFERPFAVEAGDGVTMRVRARAMDGDYAWVWDTRAEREGRETLEIHQSTFFGAPVDAGALRRRDRAFAEGLSSAGRHALEALGRLAEGVPVGDVAAELALAHPAAFPSDRAAHTFVADLAARYGA